MHKIIKKKKKKKFPSCCTLSHCIQLYIHPVSHYTSHNLQWTTAQANLGSVVHIRIFATTLFFNWWEEMAVNSHDCLIQFDKLLATSPTSLGIHIHINKIALLWIIYTHANTYQYKHEKYMTLKIPMDINKHK